VVHLAVKTMPGSGKPSELLHAARIDADAILAAARRLLARPAADLGIAAHRAELEERRCFLCGDPAAWRIVIGGEDDPLQEEDACDVHASGHLRVGRIGSAEHHEPSPGAPLSG
jgi:hypothetical protein